MRRRWMAVTAVWAAVTLGAGVAAVVTWKPKPPSPEALLARVDRFFARPWGYRVEGHGEMVSASGSADAGQRISQTYTAHGAVGPDGATDVVIAADNVATEIVAKGDRALTLIADTADELATTKWQETDAGVPLAGMGIPVQRSDVLPVLAGGHLAEKAVDPVYLRKDSGRPVIGFRIAQSDVELTIDGDGRPYRIATHTTQDVPLNGGRLTAEASDDYRLSGWTRTLDVPFPGDADIDKTPDVNEEALAAFKAAPVLQPRAIPARWVLDYADAFDDDPDCPEAELDYIDPNDPDIGYLYLYEYTPACADTRPRTAASFKAGAYVGWIDLDPDDGNTGQITAGRTLIEFDTDLAPDALAKVLADLVPLDLTKPPASLP